jgi:PIN domain-containing protein
MHIILDSNIYSADYRMKGVAFQSLFEYMRRTESQLVLPRVIREEVVADYGRRLKKDAKELEEVWRRYHHLDLSDTVPQFQKPHGRRRMRELRQKLMKPMDGFVPTYVPEIAGAFIQEAFMRGVHRIKPANDNGEELRDVILWLWALAYSDAANTEVVFISNDGGFWASDVEPHPVINRDVQSKNGRFHIFRSIQDFLKAHAPAPVEVTEEWAKKHFDIQRIEGELIDRALKALRPGMFGYSIQALSIKEHKIKGGKLYEVSPDAQFAELELQLVFKFFRICGHNSSRMFSQQDFNKERSAAGGEEET